MIRAQALDALAALASGTRLDLVRLLIGADEPGMSAGALAERLAIAPSRLSFHLAALEQAGLIGSRREGRHVIYTANRDGIGGVIGYLLHDCCAGDQRVNDCCRARAPASPAEP